MRRSSRATTALIAGLVLIAASACGDSGSSATQNQAQEPGDFAPDGIITVGQAGGISKLDPNTISSSFATVLQPLLWSGLTRWNEQMEAVPDLAESWDSSEDLTVWTFQLRQGVTFHDGTAFTAEHAVENINRVLDPEVASQERAKIESIESVEALDDHTLEITLGAPNAVLPTALVEIKMADLSDLSTIDNEANGTGPFKLSEFVADERVILERNEEYFGEPANAAEIHVVRAADTTAGRTSLASGDLDILYGLPPVDAAALGPDLQLLEPELLSGTATWEVDTTSPPFDDKRARQALSHAMNREAMLEAAYAGLGSVPTTNNLINAGNVAATEEGMTTYDFDLDRAKALFEEAGVEEGTSFTFWAMAGSYDEWVTMGEILQQDLAKIGYELEIERREVSTWLERFYPAGKSYPGTIVANYLSLPAAAPFTLSFLLPGTCECNWENSEYSELYAEATRTADEDERNEIYAQLQRILSEEVPVLVAAQATQHSAVSNSVQGAWVESDGDLRLDQAGIVAP